MMSRVCRGPLTCCKAIVIMMPQPQRMISVFLGFEIISYTPVLAPESLEYPRMHGACSPGSSAGTFSAEHSRAAAVCSSTSASSVIAGSAAAVLLPTLVYAGELAARCAGPA